ncbi:VOC family protein [Agromyces sp. NPDC058484]|uniref:VOC family protein n=1 Tax=Agromyces sp. NPDC058484 TaxID=3346524 RepID=UPI003665EB54
MKIESMELVGFVVHDLDRAVAKYSALFGVEFRSFTAGVDYELVYEDDEADTSAPSLPDQVRLAMDTTGLFEIVEVPGAREGFRNVHFRVDDIEAVAAHFTAQGARLVARLRAGTVREFIFDAADLHGIRVCLVEYEGASFAEALDASPAATGRH